VTKPTLAWLDIETTGLNVITDRILEIGIILTDNDLNMLPDAYTAIVLPYSASDRINDITSGWIPPRVAAMHHENGLFDDCDAAWDRGESPHDALVKLTGFLKHFLPETGSDDGPLHDRLPIVCGNNVDFDRQFLRQHGYEDVLQHMHHRTINVSTLRELARRWYPTTGPKIVEQAAAAGDEAVQSWGGGKKHRVLGDLRFAIGELDFYRRNIFIPLNY
jgi:oligoribonuclease